MILPLLGVLGERVGVRASVFSFTVLFSRAICIYARGMPDIERARTLRKKPIWAEKLVWSWLRDRRFGAYKFRRGHPVGPYFLDFFCYEARLSIELDGGGHGFPEQKAHDSERTRFLASLGIKELRFWNSRLRGDKHAIRETIWRELQARAPHPLPEYRKAIQSANDRPHPGPLPQGEGDRRGVF